MAQSQHLRLPNGASAAFDECNKSNQDLAKWLVYSIGSVPLSAGKLCHEAMRAYNETSLHEPESEWDEMGFAKPADETAEDVQAILDKHITTVQQVFESQESDPWNSKRLYPTGFVVVDGDDCMEKGVIVVHCDRDAEGGEWRIRQHRIAVKDLGTVLTTVLDGDDDFERMAEIYGVKDP